MAIDEGAADATVITVACVHARYEPKAPPDAEVSAVRKSWERILWAMSEEASKRKSKVR